MEIEGEKIAIRPMVADDLHFILSTWMGQFRNASPIANELYRLRQSELIHALIASPTNRTLVACSEDEDSAIIGWVCGALGGNHIHYAYVRDAARNNGIARELVKSVLGHYPNRIYVTHRFRNGVESRKRFIFNPYILRVLF